ncbi:Uncharacterised protein [uncultured archaeon]|nr:Uncharacterised protein [uncultured archaeon]
MDLTIVKSHDGIKGKLLEINVDKKSIKIIFTWHALDSMRDYDISIETVLEHLLFAEEIIRGHGGRFIAHRKLNDHLTRVVYEYEKDHITVVTFYISYVNRYFKGGIYEDKILP